MLFTKPLKPPFRDRSNAHSIPFAILRGGLIRAKIKDVRGANWEGRCSAARMPERAKREIICDVNFSIICSLRPHDIQRIASRIPSRTFLCGGRPLRAGALPVISRAKRRKKSSLQVLNPLLFHYIFAIQKSHPFPHCQKRAFHTLQKILPHARILT